MCLGAAALALVLSLNGGDSAGPVTANSMVAISSTSGHVERALPVGGNPTAVAVGAGAVWALNADDQTITRIDPKTHALRTFGTGGIPVDLAAGDGSLWVGNGTRTSAQFVGPVATSITRLDPDSAAVLATVTLPRAEGPVSNQSRYHISVTPHAVWVVNPDFTISRIDPASNRIAGEIRDVSALGVAADSGGAWALQTDGTIARLTPGDRVAQRVRVPASLLSSIAVGAGAVWLTDPDEGTLWRVDPRGPVERTIPLAVGAADVAYGAGALWVSNGLTGTVSRVDPRTNRVTAVLAVGNTPGRLAVGGQTVWTAVAGAPGTSLPVASQGGADVSALPASICGRVFSSGDAPSAAPDRVRPSPARRRAAHPADERRHRIRPAPARLQGGALQRGLPSLRRLHRPDRHLRRSQVHGEREGLGPEPARGGRGGAVQLGLRRGRDPAGEPGRPAGDDLAHQLRRRAHAHRARHRARHPRPALSHGRAQLRAAVRIGGSAGSGHGAVRAQPRPVRRLRARRPRLRLPARGELPEGGSPARSARGRHGFVESCRAELFGAGGAGGSVGSAAVYVSGLIDSHGDAVVRALRERLGARVTLLANDGFLPISALFAKAGDAASGIYVSTAALPNRQLGLAGREFVTHFGATQHGAPVDHAAVYAAQATEVMLDAIARSDGSRASVTRALRATRIRDGILGGFGFDANGDPSSTPVTIVRARTTGGEAAVESIDGADVVTVIAPRARCFASARLLSPHVRRRAPLRGASPAGRRRGATTPRSVASSPTTTT